MTVTAPPEEAQKSEVGFIGIISPGIYSTSSSRIIITRDKIMGRSPTALYARGKN